MHKLQKAESYSLSYREYSLTNPDKKNGFTLLELIVVIVIIGVLATLGFTQYTNLIENMRGAEAKVNIGSMRRAQQVYYLANGTVTGITDSDLNLGSGSDQLPKSCNSNFYFRYDYWFGADPTLGLAAYRCTSAGKTPQGTTAWRLNIDYNAATGSLIWHCSYPPGYAYASSSTSPVTCP